MSKRTHLIQKFVVFEKKLIATQNISALLYSILMSGPILESKGMFASFSEKEEKRAKYLEIWGKMYNIFK